MDVDHQPGAAPAGAGRSGVAAADPKDARVRSDHDSGRERCRPATRLVEDADERTSQQCLTWARGTVAQPGVAADQRRPNAGDRCVYRPARALGKTPSDSRSDHGGLPTRSRSGQHYWNHNVAFTGASWTRRCAVESALDVGCGDGSARTPGGVPVRRRLETDVAGSCRARRRLSGLRRLDDVMDLTFLIGTLSRSPAWPIRHHSH